ncbi:hypothetical protein GCM10020001_054070 [Nonomuraea salmonea]
MVAGGAFGAAQRADDGRGAVAVDGEAGQQLDHRVDHRRRQPRRLDADAGGQVVAVDDQLHEPGEQEVVEEQRPAGGRVDDPVGGLGGERRALHVEQRLAALDQQGGPGGRGRLTAAPDAEVALVVEPGLHPRRARVVLQERDGRLDGPVGGASASPTLTS